MAEHVFSVYLVKKPNTKSKVWQNFGIMATKDGKIIEREKDKPTCRMCGSGVQAKGSNTTNLFQHLRKHHPLIYSELAPPNKSKSVEAEPRSSNQLTLTKTVTMSAKFSSDNLPAKELNRAVTYHFAKYSVPISTIDKPGFRQLVTKLNPRYHMPSRCHFTDYEISQLYSEIKDSVVAASLNKVSFFSATTDFWKSSTCQPYITITVHFINLNGF